MRLTNAMRDDFVDAVMQDVPKLDHNAMAEKMVKDFVLADMPEKVRALYDDKKLRHRLATHRISMPGRLWNFEFYCEQNFMMTPELMATLTDLAKKYEAQDEMLDELRRKLEVVIASCTTLKAAQERLPEFVEYLPEENGGKIKTLPAVSNVVADLVKAGWPKKEEGAA